MSDECIVKMLMKRDERAITEIQHKYRAYCLSIARSILGKNEDAEECFNHTLLGVWNSIPPNTPSDLRSYVGAVCRRTALKQIEKRMAQKRGEGRGEVDFEELEAVLGGNDAKIDELALRDTLQRFLRTLTRKARCVFIQKYWYFRTVKEIAKDLGMTEDGVKASLFRSREKLRAYLNKEGYDV